MKKFGQLLKNFNKQIALKKQKRADEKAQLCLQEKKYLDQILPECFPSAQVAETFMKTLEKISKEESSNCNNLLYLTFLPAHTRDVTWLADYLSWHLSLANHGHVRYQTVRDYVRNDKKFAEMREQYEENVTMYYVKKLIKLCYNDCLEDGKNTVRKFVRDSFNADEDFRQIIFDRTTKLGLDPHTVETALEKNSDVWRPLTSETAFLNQCVVCLQPCQKYVPAESYANVVDRVMAQKNNWEMLHDYEYYKNHKAVIDEVAETNVFYLKTDGMKMHPLVYDTMKRTFENSYRNMTEPLFNNIKVMTDNHKLDD